MSKCRCRTCGREYEEHKATADWKGFCTQRCVKAKVRELGYTPKALRKTTEYRVLENHSEIGSVFV